MMKSPLLLISGLLSNELIWSYSIKKLSDVTTIQVISPSQDTPEKMLRFILEQAPNQFALAGHSMGGWLCLEVMRHAKERVTKLCLLNTTAKSDSAIKNAKRKEMIEKAENGLFQEVVEELVDHLVFNPKAKNEVKEMFIESGAQAFIRQEKSMLIRDECKSILPTIQCPTLVIHADHDKVFTLEDSQELVNNITNAKLAVIENCGHMSPLEKPEEVAVLLSSFFDG